MLRLQMMNKKGKINKNKVIKTSRKIFAMKRVRN